MAVSWIEEEGGVVLCLREYFDDIFKWFGSRSFDSVLAFVEPEISNKDNGELSKPFLESEIKEATFQLGSFKASDLDGF